MINSIWKPSLTRYETCEASPVGDSLSKTDECDDPLLGMTEKDGGAWMISPPNESWSETIFSHPENPQILRLQTSKLPYGKLT